MRLIYAHKKDKITYYIHEDGVHKPIEELLVITEDSECKLN